jgi:hypothetical protein
LAHDFDTTRVNPSNKLTCLRECRLVTATAEGRRVREVSASYRSHGVNHEPESRTQPEHETE